MYNFKQKFTSIFLLVFFIFSFVVDIPFRQFISTAYALENDFSKIVSILVEEEIYDDVEDVLERYWEDIQQVLPDTKVLITPISDDKSVFDIASFNERLYFEGLDERSIYDSSLIWTLLVWNLPVPIVFNWEESNKSIFPYVDFEKKAFIYNKNNNRYEISSESFSNIEAEIWHWVVSPNSWDRNKDVDLIIEYFDKNHDFYSKTWKFNEEDLDSVDPKVFYYDLEMQNSALNSYSFKSYEAYREYREDLAFNRYTKDLALEMQEFVSEEYQENISNLVDAFVWDLDLPNNFWDADLSWAPDYASRYLMDSLSKKFPEVFNPAKLWEIKKNIYNSWRYSDDNKDVSFDNPIFFVWFLDEISDRILKDATIEVENSIDDIIKNGVSRKIAIPTSVQEPWNLYVNFLNWTKAQDIDSAKYCSIYRWSLENWWRLVQSNRAFNFQENTQEDADFLQEVDDKCIVDKQYFYFWGNTPLNVDVEKMKTWEFVLQSSNLRNSFVPIFDLAWSVPSLDSSKVPSPVSCYENNLLLTFQDNRYWEWNDFRVPDNLNFGSSSNWTCRDYPVRKNIDKKFEEIFDSWIWAGACSNISLRLDWAEISSESWDACWDGEESSNSIYSYKTIDSLIEHKSPTLEELQANIESLSSQGLPVDRIRYISFIWADWNYKKIQYPNFFSFQLDSEFTFDDVVLEVEKNLWEKSKEINDIIVNSKPNFSWKQEEAYNLLKTWEYPDANIDLFEIFKNKESWEFKIWTQSKDIYSKDLVYFAIYWNSLPSIASKFKFIFENYLWNEFEKSSSYPLPNSSKLYEIVYLNAKWNSKWMLIEINPEDINYNPYGEIIAENVASDAVLAVNKVSYEPSLEDWEDWWFACAPPDWVPIWEWFPAVICWLWDVMDFSISFWDDSSWEDAEEIKEYISENACERDLNNNWLSDCIDKNDKFEVSWAKVFSLWESFDLTLSIWDIWWNNLIDSNSVYEVSIDSVINSSWEAVLEEDYYKYLNLVNGIWKFNWWFSSVRIITWDKTSTVNLKARAFAIDKNWDESYSLSSEYSFEVREWEVYISPRVLDTSIWYEDWILRRWNDAIVSDESNIFIYDKSLSEDNLSYLNSLSLAKQKIFLDFSTKWVDKDFNIKYPVNVKVFDSFWELVEEKFYEKEDVSNVSPIFSAKKSWLYNLVFEDSLWFKDDIELQLLAWDPVRVENKLSTNVLETWWVSTNNALVLYDKFWNIADNWFYKISAEISWKWLEFSSWDNTEIINFYDWEESYELMSTWFPARNQINFYLIEDEELEENFAPISSYVFTVSNLDFDLILSDNLKVWNKEYDFSVRVNNIDNYYWEAYIDISDIYINIPNKVKVSESRWNWKIKTKIQSWKQIPVNFYLSWLRSPRWKTINILPERPVKVDISTSASNIEANWEDNFRVYASLFDAFWNKAFNSNVEAEVEMKTKSWTILELVSPSLKYFENWDVSFDFKATKTPWIAHFKIKANIDESPFVYNNWQVENIVEVINQNATRVISSYYFRNYSDEEFSYNWLYTTLLWGAYWDITKERYLAWEFIFDRDNVALSSTSLIYDPISRPSVVDFSDKWWVSISNNLDVSQDIVSSLVNSWDNKHLRLLFINKVFNNVFSHIDYRLQNAGSFVCDEESTLFSDYYKNCLDKLEENYNNYYNADDDYLENRDYVVFDKIDNSDYFQLDEDEDGISIINKSQTNTRDIFSLNKKNWAIKVASWYNISIDLENSWKYSTFLLKQDSWEVIYRFSYILNKNIKIIDESSAYFWWATLFLNSNLYWVKLNYSNSDASSYGVSIWYNDPFTESWNITSLWDSSNKTYEKSSEEFDLWWWDDNKTLLAFASWESVWEATRKYQSVWLINIWDPVFSLKERKKSSNEKIKWDENRAFDSTIWTLIANEKNLYQYRVFDYNNDGKDDVVTLSYDMFLRLYENNNWDFIDRKELAKIYDTAKASILLSWDFTWDWYDDLFLTNQEWEIFILNNEFKDFYRIDLDDEYYKDKLVSQAKVFDMDNDGKDDIVILDDIWAINILYWWVDWDWDLNFYRKFVWEWHLVNITNDIIDFWWAVYFDWLVQPSENLKKVSSYDYDEEEMKNQIKNTVRTAIDSSSDSDASFADKIVNKRALVNLIFNKFHYIKPEENPLDNQETSPEEEAIENNENKENVLDSLWNLPWTKTQDKLLLKAFLNNAESKDKADINYSLWQETQERMYIKSQFASSTWVAIEKTFRDINWETLRSQDEVEVTIKIKNESQDRLINLSYVEDIDSAFYRHSDFRVLINWTNSFYANAPEPLYDYDFMIDGLSISVWDSVEIKYFVKMSDYTYWDLEVWYFEDWDWFDPYWDIKIKEDSFSCAWFDGLYLSVNSRDYEAWSLPLECVAKENESDKIKEQTDNILNWWEDLEKYSKDQIAELIKDINWDGKPDYQNSISELSHSNTNLLTDINDFNQKADKFMWDANDFVKWLGCWFGSWWSLPLPINAAPLAPWDAISILWYPSTVPTVVTWVPIFAMPTIWPVNILWVPVPPFWPTNFVWAWWIYAFPATSTFRIFVTPTLTLWAWTAICFGLVPTSEASFPKLINPLFQLWWNCIVVASGLWWWDWAEQLIPQVWTDASLPWRDFNIFNGNCFLKQEPQDIDFWPWSKSFVDEFVEELEKFKWVWFSDTFKSRYKTQLNQTISKEYSLFKSNVSWKSASMNSWISVTYSREWFKYKKPEDIVNKRVWWFPNFLAWWASRQIEEIANKISTAPWMIVILPKFDWVIKWYENFYDDLEDAKKSIKDDFEKEDSERKAEIQAIEKRMAQIDNEVSNIDNPSSKRILLEEKRKLLRSKQTLSRVSDSEFLNKWVQVWNDIKAWYEVISSLPAIRLTEEKVPIKVPYVTEDIIDDAVASFEYSIAQYEEEIDRFKSEIAIWRVLCEKEENEDKKSECLAKFDIAETFIIDIQELITALERNIEILESYRDIPRDLWEILRFRNKYYEQIIQNVETVSAVTWWFIKRNGIRFKAWVELFILIKAVLKSWQLLLDLFADYDASCWWDCRSNSRFNLIWFLFDTIVPDLPIIIFPKWPDIIVDLHNVTFELDVALPDFEVQFIPVLLPDLPELKLPELWNFDISIALALSGKLPDLEILPEINLKKIMLPDLPRLPSVKLPNLPPPPKVPKLFAWLEVLIQLAKLITLIECLLEEIPLVPEWRAWLQISFLTERNAYLFLDFIVDLSFPDVSNSFVDAIKIKADVNLELEADQIAESVRETVEDTVNSHSVDIASKIKTKFEWKLSDMLDFREFIDDFDTEIKIWAVIEELTEKIVIQTIDDIKRLENMSWKELDSKEFKSYMLSSLTSDRFKWDKFVSPLVKIWQDENNRKFEAEDRFIEDLYDFNNEKYGTLRSIINHHKENTFDKDLEEFKKVQDLYSDKLTLISWDYKTDLKAYNNKMNLYNSRAFSALERFKNSDSNDVYWLEKEAKRTKLALDEVSNRFALAWERLSANSLSITTWDSDYSDYSTSSSTACYAPKANWQYSPEYSQIRGHYISTPEWNYRLYDYLDEFDWSDSTVSSDVDWDWDFDIFHRIKDSIYLKTNLKSSPVERHYWDVLKIDFDEILEPYYIESLNSITPYEETWYMNISFDDYTWKSNFRFEFENIIDRTSQNPREENKFDYSINKLVIDAFSNIEENTLEIEEWDLKISKNLAFIRFVWDIPATVSLKTREMIDVSDILEKRILNISPWTRIYAWNEDIRLTIKSNWAVWDISLKKNTNLLLDRTYSIEEIRWWKAYILWAWEKKYTWNEIRNLSWVPILEDTSIKVLWNWEYSINHNIEIEYYDWSDNKIFFNDVKYYEIQDLGSFDSVSRNIWTNIPNDFYYVRWYAFDWENRWTYTRQTVSSPQKESDIFSPQINFKDISLSVYNRKTINLTTYIDDNSWIEWIKELYIDTNLDVDLDSLWWDWDFKNDRNVKLKDEEDLETYSLYRDWDNIMLSVWPFEDLESRKLNMIAIDWNDNIWSSEITVEIYAPTPYISSWWEDKLSWILDKKIDNQPIDIFRYRWGQISKITDEIDTFTNQDWEFDFSVWTESWVKIEYIWEKIADINDKTWVIEFELWSWFSYDENIKVEDSTITNSYPRIYINSWLQNIYSQYIIAPDDKNIEVVSSFNDISEEWIYFKMINQVDYSSFFIPNNASFNPWELIIKSWDTNLFRVTKDWKIFAYSWTLGLRESSLWTIFKLKYNDEVIWEIFIKSLENYYIK